MYFVLPVAGNDGVRNRKIMQNNTWLRDWCDQQNFGVFDHRSVFTTPSLTANKQRKRILAQELPGLAERALNSI